jgi:hypothetical protein
MKINAHDYPPEGTKSIRAPESFSVDIFHIYQLFLPYMLNNRIT